MTSVYEDETWIVHLDALFVLQDRLRVKNRTVAFFLPFGRSSRFPPESAVVPNVTSIMDFAVLQLRSIALEIEALFRTNETPRQLDIRKIQVASRKVRRNVDLIRALDPDPPDDILHPTLDLVLSVMHARTSSILGRVSEEQYLASDAVCSRKIRVGVESILSHARNLAESLRTSDSREIIVDTNPSRPSTALEVVWALRSILLSPAILQDQRNAAQQLLMTIGERTLMPQALAKVSLSTGEDRYLA